MMRFEKFDFSAFTAQGINRVGELNAYITLACDLRCGYCYMYDFLAKASDNIQLMAPDFFNGLVRFFAGRSGGLDRMTLLGGEPTLHPEITQMCNEIAELPIKELRMTTNGIGLHYLNLDQLQANVFDNVSVSINGITAAINDATRGKKTFNKILHTLGLYKQAGITVSVNYTVTRSNIDHLRDVIPFFAAHGVAIINLHRASLDGNAYNNNNLLVTPFEWVSARDDLLAFVAAEGHKYPGVKIRIPHIFLSAQQIIQFAYKPIQEQNYHSPDGGQRLIVFPPTAKGRGLCYMSSDVIGHPHAELGQVDASGKFTWNDHPANEMVAYRNSWSANISTQIKGQDEGLTVADNLIRVSHSFKSVINTDLLTRAHKYR